MKKARAILAIALVVANLDPLGGNQESKFK